MSEAAAYGIIDPDYARVFTIARCIAWSEGYALTMHGSFTRDLDLLAVPWTDRACEPEHLANRIADSCGLRPNGHPPGVKPHGRIAWTLMFPEFGDPRFVDLSVMPRAAATTAERERDEAMAALREKEERVKALAEARAEIERLVRINAEICRGSNILNQDGARLEVALKAAERQRDEALEALRPFAEEAGNWADSVPDDYRSLCTEPGSKAAHPGSETAFTYGDLRRARSVLSSVQPVSGSREQRGNEEG